MNKKGEGREERMRFGFLGEEEGADDGDGEGYGSLLLSKTGGLPLGLQELEIWDLVEATEAKVFFIVGEKKNFLLIDWHHKLVGSFNFSSPHCISSELVDLIVKAARGFVCKHTL
ncbi:hypothetical protein Syun_007697 [Stephania yunnanensis]|uniref:Uncharacterized protein n=1 Tax=Stephania yunnanensis TaxID=152371 RepID=A0AAP0KZ67_9MAGN